MKTLSIKNLFCTCLLLLLPFLVLPSYTWAMDQGSENKDWTEKAVDEEDLAEITTNYATLVIDWGIATLQKAPSSMDLMFWRSRTAMGCLAYNIPLQGSNFIVVCGISVANTEYLFKENYTLAREDNDRKTTLRPAQEMLPNARKIQQSSLSVNYLGFATEIKFSSDREEPQEGFFVALGGNIGFQFSPSTTIKYEEHKEHKTWKKEESFNLNNFYYGVLARIGWKRLGLFYNQTLSNLFKKESGLEDIQSLSAGISINFL